MPTDRTYAIKSHAFVDCGLESISIPNNVVDDDIIIEEATPGELDAYDDIYDCSGYL